MPDDPNVLGVCFRALFQVIDPGLGIPCKIARGSFFVYPVGFPVPRSSVRNTMNPLSGEVVRDFEKGLWPEKGSVSILFPVPDIMMAAGKGPLPDGMVSVPATCIESHDT